MQVTVNPEEAKKIEAFIQKASAAGYSEDEIKGAIEQKYAKPVQVDQQANQTPTLEKPTLRQQVQSSTPMRVVQGARDPIDAGAQLLPRGLEAVTSGFGLAPNPVSRFFGDEASRVTGINAQNERDYQAARQATGQEGFDAARLTGNIVSPVNAAIAARLPITAATKTGMALQGARAGGVGGALQPVNDPGSEFWQTKAAQTGLGAVTGGVMTPIASKVAEKIGQRIAARQAGTEIGSARASLEADSVISEALAEVNQRIDDLPKVDLDRLRAQVVNSLKTGKKLDAAALLRKADFDAEGVAPLQSWITREPTQYAREMNLRGVEGVGTPIMQRYDAANQFLQGNLRKASEGADDAVSAGERLATGLKNYDEKLRGNVSAAYKAARESAGKDLDVPLQGLAQDYATVLNNFGDKVPSGVRNQFKDLGLESGQQLKVFTIEEADKLLKVINDNWSNEPATRNALSQLSQAVKRAVNAVDETGGPFAPAVKLAADRFKLHDAVPALEAAATGKVSPDDFVNRFIIRGKTSDVKGLAGALDADSLNQARAQVGAHLQRAAFGENVAGDKVFSPERFAKALREFGDEKLSAFFSPNEVASIKRSARIGAYVNSRPNVSAVNSSNTGAALANLLGNNVQNVSRVAAVVNSLAAPIKNASAVNRALRPDVPVTPAQLTPEQLAIVAKLLSGGAAATGAATAVPFR